MKISHLDLERAVAGAKPETIERFFIQRTLPNKHAVAPAWVDARIDMNIDGCTIHDQALMVCERLQEAKYFPDGVELRVIRRTITIETEVVGK